jgi:hypothetical protein
MPYKLVHALQELMTLQFTAKKNTNLESTEDLPDEVLDKIDVIQQLAKLTFGTQIKPTLQQEHVMKTNGFTVLPNKVDMVGWKSGKITTPRGDIFYP